jgi:hypothetical protein
MQQSRKVPQTAKSRRACEPLSPYATRALPKRCYTNSIAAAQTRNFSLPSSSWHSYCSRSISSPVAAPPRPPRSPKPTATRLGLRAQGARRFVHLPAKRNSRGGRIGALSASRGEARSFEIKKARPISSAGGPREVRPRESSSNIGSQVKYQQSASCPQTVCRRAEGTVLGPSRTAACRRDGRARSALVVWPQRLVCRRAILSFTSNLRRFKSAIWRLSIEGWARASTIAASSA